MTDVLVIDDEPFIRHAFRKAFEETELTLRTAGNAAEGMEVLARDRPYVVVLDINLPDLSGLDVYGHIRLFDARIPVIFITGHGSTETAIEAMKLGAFDYLLKPLDVIQVRELVTRACEVGRLARVPALIPDEPPAPGQSDVLVGRCPAMQEVYKAIGRVAPQNVIGADPGRERHGQGTGGPGNLPAQSPRVRPLPGRQLRRDPRDLARERAVRP